MSVELERGEACEHNNESPASVQMGPAKRSF